MKKSFVGIALLSIICVGLTGCGHEHNWVEATCTEPRTCSQCGEIEGEALGHSWMEATCTEPKTCRNCGETEGEALGHSWMEATCTEPRTCSICRETEGDVVHIWQEATCILSKTCSQCGQTEGEALGHNWLEATCIAPQTCTICGETEGDLAPHDYNDSGICRVCGETREIELTLNNYEDYLDISYETFSNSSWRSGDGELSNAQGWRAIAVTIAPKSGEYAFQDVQVGFKFYYSGRKGNQYSSRATYIDVDTTGNRIWYPNFYEGPSGSYMGDCFIDLFVDDINGSVIK